GVQDWAELGPDEGPERLPDDVGRDDARDAKAISDLGRDRRLPDAGSSSDQQHYRPLVMPHLAHDQVAAGVLVSCLPAQKLGYLLEHVCRADHVRLEPVELLLD